MGLTMAGNRQRAILITAGPLMLVAGMSMTDEIHLGGLHAGAGLTGASQADHRGPWR